MNDQDGAAVDHKLIRRDLTYSFLFDLDDYRTHTTCTYTEKDNLVADRGSKNKKQTPQEAWMELLQASVSTAPSGIKSHLQQMVHLDNIPRKEKQFRNFATNSLNLRGANAKKILDSIWSHLNEQREKMKQAKAEAEQAKQQKKEEKQQQSAKEDKKPETKQQTASPADKETSENPSPSSEVSDEDQKSDSDVDEKLYKDVKKATKKLLKKAKGQSMKYKSLQKALREKMGVSKKKLKVTMETVVAKEAKKFQLEGKQIKLVVT